MSTKGLHGLTAQIKDKLIQQALEGRLRKIAAGAPGQGSGAGINKTDGGEMGTIPPDFYRFDLHTGYKQIQIVKHEAERFDVASPFFKCITGKAGAMARLGERDYINFASYNYLGLSGDAEVSAAAKAAIDTYGTSASASRIVSGTRPIHEALERALAQAHGTEDALTFVSGVLTNMTTIGYLFGPRDLVVHDEFIHNSIVQGIALSGAKRIPFPHNDWLELDHILAAQRRRFERVLVVLEGVYSMDGDYPDLPRFIEIKNRHRCFLMIDEAHSFGVMGPTGGGIREHFGCDSRQVDIWMGTLSKSLAGCGGYIAGEAALVEHLRYLAPGFLYSVGMPPPMAAASLAALRKMQLEPDRVSRLQKNGRLFLDLARSAGLDVGRSAGYAVVPVITGSPLKAARLSAALLERGINAQPIAYPAVPEKAARVRFFISCDHTPAQIEHTIQEILAVT
jgi:8-amino-7-oxononanoate synthase